MSSISLYRWQFAPEPTLAAPANGTTLQCTVSKVIDGDSIIAKCPEGKLEIRLHGIDAPEMGQKPWGQRAKKALKNLVAKQSVRIEITDTDRYGRSVSSLYIHQQDVALALIEQGWVTVYHQYNDKPEYAAAENQARAKKHGIWSTNGAQQQPSKWRKYHNP